MALTVWSAVRFLWAVLGAVAAAYLLASASSSTGTDAAGLMIVAAGIVFLLGAPWVLADQWLHQQERNARAQKTYDVLRRSNAPLNAPLVFYLRSFDWDERFGNERMQRSILGPWILWIFFNWIILLFFVWQRLYQRLGGRLESMLHRAASQSCGPMIDVSLGRAQGRGFGRVSTTDAEWKQTAGALLDRADLVFMMFSDTTGTSWELQQLVERGRLARTVFLVPPAYALRTDVDTRKYQLERDYRIFSERMSALGYATPKYQQAMAFRVDAHPDRVRFVCFDKDFDGGGTKQLRTWLHEQISEISSDGSLNAKRAKARWRGGAAGFARLGVAALLGVLVAINLQQQASAWNREQTLLQTQCDGYDASVADETLISACSSLIADTGGEQYADINLINNRGLAHLRLGQYELASADFSHLIARNGADSTAFFNRASTRHAQGDLDGAIQDYSQVVALGAHDLTLADAYSSRGLILAERDDADGALRDYDAAIQLFSDYSETIEGNEARQTWISRYATTYVLRAQASMNLQNFAAAVDDCTRALELAPELRDAYATRALAYVASGDDASALPDFDRAIALNPEYATTRRLRGQARIRLGRIAEGEADLADADALEAPQAASAP
jgi:tetratricopeptide (TPR) repeat protein